MEAIIHDERRRKWWRFAYPRRYIQATTYDEVLPALAEIEAATQDGAHAVGFIAYEAAPAFDSALQTHAPNRFPLLAFGIFDAPDRIEIPHQVDEPYHVGEWHPDMSPEAYQRAIAHIKAAIAQGDTLSGKPVGIFRRFVSRARSPTCRLP